MIFVFDGFSKFRKIICLSVCLILGCGRLEGQTIDSSKSASMLTKVPPSDELLAISAPAYEVNAAKRQECFGRLVFEVVDDAQWPLYHRGNGNMFVRSFSKNVYNRSDVMRFANYMVAVFSASDKKTRELVRWDLPIVAQSNYDKYIQEAEQSLIEMKKGNKYSENSWNSLTEGIADWKRSKAKLDAETFKFDPGLSESEGYGKVITDGASKVPNYSVLRAYLTRGNYIFVFESSKAIDSPNSREIHGKEFVALLKKFRTRAAAEIPLEPGLCIPYGFIMDDGTMSSDMKLSFRTSDAAGVLYTIHTGSAENRPSMPLVRAHSSASVGRMGTPEDEEVSQFITERIGPRKYKIGGVSAMQGGVAARIVEPSSDPYETYQVFTGYSGFPQFETLPFIYVELNTTTMHMAPELKQNPPPFKQSMERYESLLRSIRLRPTTPPMPDSASVKATQSTPSK